MPKKPTTVTRPIQVKAVAVAFLMTIAVLIWLLVENASQAPLLVIGVGLGVSLYHAAFGFTSAYRRAILDRDISAITAQLLMLGAAILLFAPILAQGSAFGQGVGGALAPVSVSMALGAFLFGIGMQLGGSCASGTLYTAGGGSPRMMVVLVFFCIGTFWGSLDLLWWAGLPGIGAVSLGRELGWEIALPLQLGGLALVYFVLRLLGGRNRPHRLWGDEFVWRHIVQGPWPLLVSAGLLALLNWATLLIAGHPWSITWGFTLWGAKAAMLMGWDPATSAFWTGGFQEAALAAPILTDNVSITNIGILLGAFLAAALAGKISPQFKVPAASLAAAVIGGVVMGYGARLAYGCNIGAFFSGVASGSLHGWVWIACAIPGNIIGVRLRPLFRLQH